MLKIVRSDERYRLQTDWLDARWHFSFDRYYDPENVSFGPLRVFNNDIVQPGQGFPMHPHRDMEIVTYVIDGALKHRDSTGGEGTIEAGEVQRMSAGSGIRHSEFNASATDPVELLQVWVIPSQQGVEPSYEQKRFSLEDRRGKLLAIAEPTPRNGAVSIGRDVTFYVSHLDPGATVAHRLEPGRRAYVFVISGEVEMNGEALSRGDSVKASEVDRLGFAARDEAELMLIDLP